jgi:hypothetical protein
MINPSFIEERPESSDAQPEASVLEVAAEIRELLLRAATRAAEQDVDLDRFMSTAWHAYMEARPGLREQLEDLELAAQVEQLRKRGQLALA